MEDKTRFGKKFLIFALISLTIGLIAGGLSVITYISPEFLRDQFQGLLRLRPFHVSYVMFWIILSATGCVYIGLIILSNRTPKKSIFYLQISLWVIALLGIGYSYSKGEFGGREYWKFNPIWALPILISWALFLVNFFYLAKGIKDWPVYVWMWMTGILFFLFTFIENYLWVFPYFREHFITDMTIQWKANGSLVGSINQLTYGVAFFIMDRINGVKDYKIGRSKLAFTIFFLGLFNLMFNWGHHIYSLPTESYIRYVGYTVSMTEWILFVRIIYKWRHGLKEIRRNYYYFPYRFIMASNFWVFVNLGIASLMSIPVLNIYVHGTHVIVAHSMGTTIGINTMILFAGVFMFFTHKNQMKKSSKNIVNVAFWTIQISLLTFFIALNIAGIIKGIWNLTPNKSSFSEMMNQLYSYFMVFAVSGFVLMTGFFLLIWMALKFSRTQKSNLHILKSKTNE